MGESVMGHFMPLPSACLSVKEGGSQKEGRLPNLLGISITNTMTLCRLLGSAFCTRLCRGQAKNQVSK